MTAGDRAVTIGAGNRDKDAPPMAKILLAEDDRDLSEVICFALQSKKHIVQPVYDGVECLAYLRTSSFDLIILDWMMPGKSGIEVCREYRARGGTTPVLILTARTTIDDRESGLDSGADDYLTKPFDQRELFARVRALLRRPDTMVGDVLRVGVIEMDTVRGLVTVGGTEVALRPKEYSLLEFFLRHPNQAFSTNAILDRVWMDDALATPDNLKTHVKLLRRKLDIAGGAAQLRTVKGRGYMMTKD